MPYTKPDSLEDMEEHHDADPVEPELKEPNNLSTFVNTVTYSTFVLSCISNSAFNHNVACIIVTQIWVREAIQGEEVAKTA